MGTEDSKARIHRDKNRKFSIGKASFARLLEQLILIRLGFIIAQNMAS